MDIVARIDQYKSMLTNEFDDYSMSENLFLQSTSPDSLVSPWSKYVATTWLGLTTAPDNTDTAVRYAEATGDITFISQSVNLSASTTYTCSIWAKLISGAVNSSSPSIITVSYNNGTTLVQSSINMNGNITTEWKRFSITFTNVNAVSLSLMAFYYTSGSSTTTSVAFWGAQIEKGSVATDYTPTTTTAINRVLASTTNTNITGLGTYYSSGFDENVGFATTIPSNIAMRQCNDKSVIVYNEIDEFSGFRDIVTSGLVLDLDAGMDASFNNKETTWYDLSGNRNNGTLVNGVGYSGANGGSLVFDGSNDYVNTGFTYANDSDFTMCCWMKTSTTQVSGLIGFRSFFNLTAHQAQIYIAGDGDANTVGNNISFNNFMTISPGVYASRPVFVDGVNVTDGNWRYIVANSNSTVSKVYIDAVLVGTSVVTSPLTRGLANFIVGGAGNYGSSPIYSNYYYNGQISNASFYTRELSAAEILQNYNAIKSRYGL